MLMRLFAHPELSPGGTWCTCAQGGNSEPPADVAPAVLIQNRVEVSLGAGSRQVNVAETSNENFSRFILVDDNGVELATGVPTGNTPALREREHNFQMLEGGRYATAARERANQ